MYLSNISLSVICFLSSLSSNQGYLFSYLFLINRTIFVRETSFQQVLLLKACLSNKNSPVNEKKIRKHMEKQDEKSTFTNKGICLYHAYLLLALLFFGYLLICCIVYIPFLQTLSDSDLEFVVKLLALF